MTNLREEKLESIEESGGGICFVLARLGWCLVLLGWLGAAVFANGGELWKVAGVVPLVGVGTLLCLLERKGGNGFLDGMVLIVVGYFLVRGWYSEVYDIARYDMLLVGMSALSYFSAAQMMTSRWGRGMFLGSLGMGIVFQVGGVMWQLWGEREWTLLRGRKVSNEGLSGLFYFQNYLAGYLELLVPALLSWIVLHRRFSLQVGVLSILVILGVGCGYLTHVRSGFAALAVASMIVLLLAVKFGHSDSLAGRGTRTWARKGGLLLGVSAMALLFLAVGKAVFESRGGEDAAAMNLHARLKMAGSAFDTWQQSPVFGVGANGFSYYFPQLNEGFRKSFGDAKMAHNEYLQVLADYGLIGLVLVLAVWSVALVSAWKGLSQKNASGRMGLWLSVVTFAVLFAEALRATIDFNLHALPNLMTLSLLVGGGACQKGGKTGFPFLSWVAGSGLVGVVFFVGLREIVTLPSQVELLRARARGDSLEIAQQYQVIQERAPEFDTSLKASRLSLASYLAEPSDENLNRARVDWEQTVKLHPHDGEAAANLARVYGEVGEYQKAEILFGYAIALTGRREQSYGALYAYAGYLVKRSQEAWMSRSPEQALGWLLEASEVLKVSSYRGEGFRQLAFFVDDRIVFFEKARIEPQEPKTIDWENAYEQALDPVPVSRIHPKPQF